MAKRSVRSGRTAKQKAASRKNLEAARKRRIQQGNSILMGSGLSKAQKRQADTHFRKADLYGNILKGKKPTGKRKMKRIYG